MNACEYVYIYKIYIYINDLFGKLSWRLQEKSPILSQSSWSSNVDALSPEICSICSQSYLNERSLKDQTAHLQSKHHQI